MPNHNVRVIPIRETTRQSGADDLVADFAYTLWISSAFRGNSPEDALLAAWQVVRGRTSGNLFLVPERRQKQG